MTEQTDVIASPDRPRRRGTTGLVAAGVAVGLALGGIGVATAQSGPSATPSASSSADDGAKSERMPGKKSDRGGFGRHGLGMGLGRGLVHGEFTAAAPAGGYQTLAMQRGEVTAANSSSLTVKSVDGFTRTYVVDDNTLVNAGNTGVSDVKTGDTVHVVAVLTGETARAVRVVDVTRVRELTERWKSRTDGATTRAPASRV